MTGPGGYTLIDHTGDIGIVVRAGSLEQLFIAAATAMFDILLEPAEEKSSRFFPIEVEGIDLEDLIVRWLSELLYLHDAKRLAFLDFEIESLSTPAPGDAAGAAPSSAGRGGPGISSSGLLSRGRAEPGFVLRAVARGEPLDPERHRIRTELKAVTHHMTLVSEDREGWSARVIFDI